MNLKEAFQAQNRIEELLNYIGRYLSDENNIMTVTEKHFRSKALAGQQDESIDVSRKNAEDFKVDELIEIWQKLMTEKENLSTAIWKAKTEMNFNFDAAVDINKSRRLFLETILRMASRKSSHELQKGAGKGYVFNNDGNQTAYFYDIDRIVTIDYDRNKIRALAKKLSREADELSRKIDEALLNTQVEYDLQIDLSGEYRLVIEEMLEK